jgi:hypothetical protein
MRRACELQCIEQVLVGFLVRNHFYPGTQNLSSLVTNIGWHTIFEPAYAGRYNQDQEQVFQHQDGVNLKRPIIPHHQIVGAACQFLQVAQQVDNIQHARKPVLREAENTIETQAGAVARDRTAGRLRFGRLSTRFHNGSEWDFIVVLHLQRSSHLGGNNSHHPEQVQDHHHYPDMQGTINP